MARGEQAKWPELRAARGLARLSTEQGKRSEAHDLLTPIYAWFTEGFHTPDMIEARMLVDELS